MSETVEKLKPVLAALPEADRWELLGVLFDLLPGPSGLRSEDDPGFDATLQRRADELESGKVKGVPAEEVLERLRKKYAK